MDIATAMEQSYDQTATLAAGLDATALAGLTRCEGWDVRALLEHLLRAAALFTRVNTGSPAGDEPADLFGEDPASAVVTAARENVASWRRPGAFDGERTYPFGTFPAEAAALLNLEEVVVHTWDLATAIGQPHAIDPDIAQLIIGWTRSVALDDLRAYGAYGPAVEVAPSAPVVEQMLAILGRHA